MSHKIVKLPVNKYAIAKYRISYSQLLHPQHIDLQTIHLSIFHLCLHTEHSLEWGPQLLMPVTPDLWHLDTRYFPHVLIALSYFILFYLLINIFLLWRAKKRRRKCLHISWGPYSFSLLFLKRDILSSDFRSEFRLILSWI